MTTLADRLRGIVRPAVAGSAAESRAEYPSIGLAEDATARDTRCGGVDAAAAVLEGVWAGPQGHRYLVVDRRYPPGHCHGRASIADAFPPDAGVWPSFQVLLGSHGTQVSGGRLLFLDLETTGLAGGAGTYAFLVGLGWFEGPAFRVRQFFLSNYAAERVLLEAIADEASRSACLVTFNGKSFDLPLVDTRLTLHRVPASVAGAPHLDMLHPARRLWRHEDEQGGGSCRLTALEHTLWGHRREGDVPGFEIPSRYFHYVRTGDARPLAAVLEHNRADILSLALLTARAAQLAADGPAAARTAREAFGLGRLYERGERVEDALAAYARAADLPGDAATVADALCSAALLHRRRRAYHSAAAAWRRVLSLQGCPTAAARIATEALAVHHEHRARDLEEARRLALQSLQFNVSRARATAAQHRLARLDRKLGSDPAEPLHAILF